ncbi:MAG: CvpA family protein [Verrucomicrobiia bacterium]
MFANAMQSLVSNGLAANWFDAVVVLMLGFGIFRGRKNGMSKEILPLFQWLAVIFVCGLFYSMVAQLLAKTAGLDQMTSCLLGYGILALAVFLIFSLLKRIVGLRLFGSSIFGGAEYYLGMPSGMVRFACMLIFALAFLNARHFTPAQIEASNSYQEHWYGAHFFPDLYTVQDEVFKQSFTGPYIKDYLGVLLITPVTASGSGNQPVQDEPAE